MIGILVSSAFVWLIAYMCAYEMDMWNVYHGKPEYIVCATLLAFIYVAIAFGIRKMIRNKTSHDR